MMSFEDGLSILKKMLEEQSNLSVFFVESGKQDRFSSSLLDMPNESSILLARSRVSALCLTLQGAQFKYADTREAAHPDKAAEIFDFCLEISWPNGALCRLYVVRDDFDPATS